MFWKSINRSPDAGQSAGAQVEDDPLETGEGLETEEGASEKSTQGDESSSDEGEAKKDKEESEVSFLPEDVEIPEDVKGLFDDVNTRMKSAFNKKMTELSNKGKGKISVDSYEELLNNQEFMSWAEAQLKTQGYNQPILGVEGDVTKMSMQQALQGWNKFSTDQQKVYWNGLTPSDQFTFNLGVQQQNTTQQNADVKQGTVDAQMVEKYGDKYIAKKNEIAKMQKDIASHPYIYSDEAFKVLDYTDFGKREYERGLLEGKKGVKQKIDDGSIRPKGRSGTKGKTRVKPKTFREAYGQAEEEVSSVI